MVSNSLKHAFPGRKTGEIRIKLFRKELNQYSDIREEAGFENSNIDLTLIVSDNGVGIPEIVDIENPETLGLQLIDILVNQLDGKIEQRRENGTKFILSLII
jgi:two-component sensor histidine kinase